MINGAKMSEQTSYFGECVGGPWDTQRLDHTRKVKMLYRYLPGRDEAVMIGEYRLNDFGQWHWWPTEEDPAMNVLFGPPQT